MTFSIQGELPLNAVSASVFGCLPQGLCIPTRFSTFPTIRLESAQKMKTHVLMNRVSQSRTFHASYTHHTNS